MLDQTLLRIADWMNGRSRSAHVRAIPAISLGLFRSNLRRRIAGLSSLEGLAALSHRGLCNMVTEIYSGPISGYTGKLAAFAGEERLERLALSLNITQDFVVSYCDRWVR